MTASAHWVRVVGGKEVGLQSADLHGVLVKGTDGNLLVPAGGSSAVQEGHRVLVTHGLVCDEAKKGR